MAADYQSGFSEFLYEPDQTWLFPAGKGYSVRIGVNATDAIGYVGAIPESERSYEDGEPARFRVNRLDLWDREYLTAAEAARALITRNRAGGGD